MRARPSRVGALQIEQLTIISRHSIECKRRDEMLKNIYISHQSAALDQKQIPIDPSVRHRLYVSVLHTLLYTLSHIDAVSHHPVSMTPRAVLAVRVIAPALFALR